MSDRTILVVDDTPANLEVLVRTLSEVGFEVSVALDGESAIEQLDHELPDLILLDVLMPGIDGFETCRRIKARTDARDIPVIFMTALSETEDKVRGFQTGAVDYVTKPLQHDEVLARAHTHLDLRELRQSLEEKVSKRTAELQHALAEVEQLKGKLEAENVYLQEEIRHAHNFENIIGQSQPLQTVLEKVKQIAPTEATVLITGETGTGKELLARAVRDLSARKDRPLVRVNCAALPSELIESELFGHEAGAFTGAVNQRIGRFELADNGTLFLDEVGDLPLTLQAKLLRVLQEGEFERLGSSQTREVNVRIIAAANTNLQEAVQTSAFREDLYYRLNVFPIHSPSLRERPEDIPLLTAHFIAKYSAEIGKPIAGVTETAMAALQAYDWPGNVRELENVIERAVIVCQDNQLTPGDWLPQNRGASTGGAKPATLDAHERIHILNVLELTKWKVRGDDGAAALLGIKPTTLDARMKKLGIERQA